jgi:hypothetical protein
VLDRVAQSYPNLYHRQSFDSTTRQHTFKVGFHTNSSTKQLLINNLIQWVRDAQYIEPDSDACDEMAAYIEPKPGVYQATLGNHDDIIMSRALALHALQTHLRNHIPINVPPDALMPTKAFLSPDADSSNAARASNW